MVSLLLSSILVISGGPYLNCFRPFWPFGVGIFIIFGSFGRFWRAVFLLFPAILALFRRQYFYYFWPFSENGIFIIFGGFGHFYGVVFLLFSAILAVFGGRYF